MNKHPSCTYTWPETTRTSLELSEALASIMKGNAHLERVLIAEFERRVDTENSALMRKETEASRLHLTAARGHLLTSIAIGEARGNPYVGDFRALNPGLLAELWEQSILTGCKEEVRRIGQELRRDHLSTARRFVEKVGELISMTDTVIRDFDRAAKLAHAGRLKQAIEKGKLPLQADFALLFSHYMAFMKEYLVDSLVATEIVFTVKGTSLLAS